MSLDTAIAQIDQVLSLQASLQTPLPRRVAQSAPHRRYHELCPGSERPDDRARRLARLRRPRRRRAVRRRHPGGRPEVRRRRPR